MFSTRCQQVRRKSQRHACCGWLGSRWSGLVEAGINANETFDDAKKQEELAKWRKREAGFGDICGPVIAKGKSIAPPLPAQLDADA